MGSRNGRIKGRTAISPCLTCDDPERYTTIDRMALTKVDANTAKSKETFNTHPKTSDRLKKLPGGAKKKGK